MPRDADQFYRSLVEGLGDMVAAFDMTGRVIFVSSASTTLLGIDPESMIGRNVIEFVHPDDQDRALRGIAFGARYGASPSAAVFRLVNRYGEPVVVDLTSGMATDSVYGTVYTVACRRAESRQALHSTLFNLLDGVSPVESLQPVCDMFSWQQNGSQVGVSWRDGAGTHAAVTSGIDADLAGAHEDADTPWAMVRHTGESLFADDLNMLDPARRAMAEAAGLAAYWIEPVQSAAPEPALITVWTRFGARPPINHELAMDTARSLVELILQWFEQRRLLDIAAFNDPLTMLANRKAFFTAMTNCPDGGTVLYCDLDRFKPVNDRYGHAAGDTVLQTIAERLTRCVRVGDIVARVGGDEFAILCPGLTAEEARKLARRIRDSVMQPVKVDGGLVEVGISVGVASDSERVTEALIERADAELYAAKRSVAEQEYPG